MHMDICVYNCKYMTANAFIDNGDVMLLNFAVPFSQGSRFT